MANIEPCTEVVNITVHTTKFLVNSVKPKNSMQLRLTVNISSGRSPMLNLLRSLVLTSPISNICLHSNQLGYHMFGLSWPRLKPPGPVFNYLNLYHWDLSGTCSLLSYWYIGLLGLNPDRLARFGLSGSSIDTWVDSLCVSEICKLLVTKLDRIQSKDWTIFETRPTLSQV